MSEQKAEGIVGFTKMFREEMIDLPEGSTVVFTGSKAVCAPFAELLAYSVRDKKFELYFSPMANWRDCRALEWKEGAGYGVASTGREIPEATAVVILGGLAMPKFGCPVEDARQFAQKLLMPGSSKLIGVCFMDIFKRAGWNKLIKFDALINATLECEKQV